MASNNKQNSKCHICGNVTKLSYEHIPPRESYNSHNRLEYGIEELLKNDNLILTNNGARWKHQSQNGFGKYSLCSSCNNNTGSWYGEDYNKFTGTISNAILDKGGILHGFDMPVTIEDFYPLRIIKQVMSMFCSTNGEDFIDDELKTFLLNKEATGLDNQKYKITMYVTDCKDIKISGLISKYNIKTNNFFVASEIVAYPFGFIMYLNPNDNIDFIGCDITWCADYKYNDCGTVDFHLPMYEINTALPLDFRSIDEILKQK